MKKLILLLILIPLFGYTQEISYSLDLEVKITDPLNIPYFVEGKELTTLIMQGIKTGKLKPFDPYSKKLITKSEVLSRTEIPSYSDEGNEVKYYTNTSDLGLYLCHNVLLDTNSKKRKINLDYIYLTIPATLPSNIKGIEMSVAGVKFTEVADYLKENKAIWYNPRNNADSMNTVDAILAGRYKFHGFVLKDAKGRYLFSMFEEKRNQWIDWDIINGLVSKSLIKETISKGKISPVVSYFEDYFQNIDSTNRIPKTLEVRPDVKNTYLKFTTKRWKLIDSSLYPTLFGSGKQVFSAINNGNIKAYGATYNEPIISTEGMTDQNLKQINIEEVLIVTGPKEFSWKIKSIIYTSPNASEGKDVERFKIMYEDFLKWAPKNLGEELTKFIETNRFYDGSMTVKNIFQDYIAVNFDEHLCVSSDVNFNKRGLYKESFYKDFENTKISVKQNCEEQLEYLYNFILNVPPDKLTIAPTLELALLLPENQGRIDFDNYAKSKNPYPPLAPFKNLKVLMFSSMYVSDFPEDLSKLENLNEIIIMDWSELDMDKFYTQIAQIKNLRSLRFVIMKKTDFLGIEKLKNIESLDIESDSLINFDQVFTGLPALKILKVYTPNFTALPSSIVKLTNLEELELPGNKLEDLSKEMKKLKQLKKLKKLSFYKSRFSEKEKAKHKKLLPNVEILYFE